MAAFIAPIAHLHGMPQYSLLMCIFRTVGDSVVKAESRVAGR